LDLAARKVVLQVTLKDVYEGLLGLWRVDGWAKASRLIGGLLGCIELLHRVAKGALLLIGPSNRFFESLFNFEVGLLCGWLRVRKQLREKVLLDKAAHQKVAKLRLGGCLLLLGSSKQLVQVVQ
jgi:hypothetical protein